MHNRAQQLQFDFQILKISQVVTNIPTKILGYFETLFVAQGWKDPDGVLVHG